MKIDLIDALKMALRAASGFIAFGLFCLTTALYVQGEMQAQASVTENLDSKIDQKSALLESKIDKSDAIEAVRFGYIKEQLDTLVNDVKDMKDDR